MNAPSPPRSLLGRLARPLVTVGALVLCYFLLRKLDWRQVMSVLGHASWLPVIGAVALNLTVNLLARTLRWWALLRPMPTRALPGPPVAPIKLWELGLLLGASYAANNLLPARAGEAIRPMYLRRHGYSTGSVVASQLVEKLIEALSLGLLGLLVAIFDAPPAPIRFSLLAFATVGPLGLIACAVIGRRMAKKTSPTSENADPSAENDHPTPENADPTPKIGLRARIVRFLQRLGEAMDMMSAPAVWLRSLFWSAVSDLTDVLMLGLCLVAVGVHLSLTSWFLTFLVINLAIAIPSTPGQVGVLEAGALLVLRALGVPDGEALAFAILYHAAHIVPLTLLGVIVLRFIDIPGRIFDASAKSR